MTNVRNLDTVSWESGSDRRLTNNTYRVTVDGEPGVKFHATVIIRRVREDVYALDSGGWQTSTTKQRLNALLPGGVTISQRNFDWTVHTRRGDIPFSDGMHVALNDY